MRVIGMISGTSFDAVEAVLADLELREDVLACDLVEHRSVSYPPAVRDAISAMLPPAATTIEQVCQLDVSIGHFFGSVAKDIQGAHGGVDAVCSHGQTVFHWVEGGTARGTLQLGEPAWIAEATGAAVVSDVRNRDIAAGGHGAPLASLLDVLLLSREPAVASGSLNLGGIANVTVVGPRARTHSLRHRPSQCPPRCHRRMVDERRGAISTVTAPGQPGATSTSELVRRLLDDPYFSLPPPKSTGKEYFNLGYVTSRLDDRDGPNPHRRPAGVAHRGDRRDGRSALRPFDLGELLVAGGGTRNRLSHGRAAVASPGRADKADGRARRA